MALDRSRRGDRRIAVARQPADTAQIEVLILERMHELTQGRGALALARLDVHGPGGRVVHARSRVSSASSAFRSVPLPPVRSPSAR